MFNIVLFFIFEFIRYYKMYCRGQVPPWPVATKAGGDGTPPLQMYNKCIKIFTFNYCKSFNP